MRNQNTPGKPNKRPGNRPQQPFSSMATPRRPEPQQRIGWVGMLFLIGILGGFVWLLMLIFGWGPYAVAVSDITPTPTASPTAVISPSPTQTVTPGPSPTPSLTPTITRTPTLEPRPYILSGEPEAMNSDLIRPGLGCSWLVVAGQVWGLGGDPVTGLQVQLFGELGGFSIDRYAITGSATAYGPSGYEFTLENMVITSRESLFIQLGDAEGNPLSHPYAIETFQDCQRNLIVVNFQQVR